MKVESLGAAELAELEAAIVQRKKEIEKERLANAAKDITAALATHGVSLDEVLPLLGKRAGKSTKAPAKYRNPDDATQTWTGRGRKPNWIVEALAKGKSLDDFAI
ncbi:H-NS family nucleoid-associated regulatory protein [Aliiroseovarius sp. PTFE2010]|uniref:H-NS histone family protein n=1 Tax=Aliiroseovarius sp. PTFE2010 TaxID=3417190 RepID=UPI003CF38EC6